jgi:hypothetical protein
MSRTIIMMRSVCVSMIYIPFSAMAPALACPHIGVGPNDLAATSTSYGRYIPTKKKWTNYVTHMSLDS